MKVALVLPLVLVALGCGDAASTGAGGSGGLGATTSTANVTSSASSATGSTGATTTSSGTGGASNASKCATSGFAICESFEGASPGSFPSGWGARGDEWGMGTIGVTDTDAVRGSHSLHAKGGSTGQHFMEYKGALGGLASSHYGRVFMKVAIPAPVPATGVLHADFVEGLGPHPGGGTNNVRWGTVEDTTAKFAWIYNVQPSQGEPEFAEGTPYQYAWDGKWQCIEWRYDEPSQTGTLWIDGAEIPITPGASHVAEIPVFTSLGVGLANYQDAGGGFDVWFDELAYDPSRIGCDN
jgi:hypothetical protein